MPLGVKREGYQASLLIIHTPGGFITREGNTKVFFITIQPQYYYLTWGSGKKNTFKNENFHISFINMTYYVLLFHYV